MEITPLEINKLMNRAVRNAKGCLKAEGSFFPTLLMYKKEEIIKIDLEHKTIALIQNDEETDTVPREYIGADDKRIYVSQVLFHRRSEDEEQAIDELIAKLVKKYKPEACGLIMKCAYREELSSLKSGLPIELDPDSVDLLYAAYFLPSEVKYEIFIPFINRGELSLEKKQVAINDEDKVNYDITFIETGWSVGKEGLKDLCQNPYTM